MRIMYRLTILILTSVQLLLVEGVKPGSVLINKSGIENNSTRRILFGTRALARDFPYLVGIRIHEKNSVCAGSIIAKHWVLTAAHCIYGASCSKVQMYPAAWKRPQSVYAAQCHTHEKFREANYEYDIALIKVAEDILQDGRAKKINLPPPNLISPVGNLIIIVGWGRTEKKVYPLALLRADVNVMDWDKCNAEYLNNHEPGTREMPRRIMCVKGVGSSPAGTCIGDSGGPGASADGYLMGVASFVLSDYDGFCKIGGPSMFVSVVDYLPWIYRFVDPAIDTTNFKVRPEHKVPWDNKRMMD